MLTTIVARSFDLRIYPYFLTASLVAVAAPIHAQQAGVQIALLDAATDQPVSNVEVIIENAEIGFSRTIRSNYQGSVRIEGLTTAGTYQISTAETDAYKSHKQALLALRSNHTSSVTLRLEPLAAIGIVVTGRRGITKLNNVNAEVSASLGREELVNLPIEGRDVLGSLIRLPNVVPSTGFFPEAPSISINGSNGLDTNYLLDGLDNNENFLGGPKFPVPLGFTREVTVLANSYSVAYGRTANGIVNYTTPSGGNDYKGEFYALVRPGRPLDAKSPFARRDLSGNAVGESFERTQAGASLGGALVRDKTFFFVNFEYTRDRNVQLVDAPALGAFDTVEGNNAFHLGSVRIDHRLTEDWTLSLRGNIGRVTIERPGGGLGGGNVTFPSAGSDQDRFSSLAAAAASYSGDNWSYDGTVQFSRFRWNYGKPRASVGSQVTVRDPSGFTVGIVGHPGFVFNELEESFQTTHRFQTKIGNHQLSFGGDLILSNFNLLGGGNPNGNFIVDLTAEQIASISARGKGLSLTSQDILSLNPAIAPNGYSVELRPQEFGKGQSLIAFYLEDEAQLTPTLTATLGLRWDYDSLTGKGEKGGDFNNIAPRFSLNYRPDARSSLRFGAGIFSGKLSYAAISDALQRNTTSAGLLNQLGELRTLGIIPAGADLSQATFTGNLTANPACANVATCPTPAQVQALRDTTTLGEARILNPRGYRNPWSFQLSGGYQFQATDTVVLSVDLIYKSSRNLLRLRDLNAPQPFASNLANLTPANIALLRNQPDNATRQLLAQSLGLVRSATDADTGRPVALIAGGARQITVSETEGKSDYKALILQANKMRGDDPFAFRLSYTFSKLANDTDDINFRASNANDFMAEWGPSANDRRHIISAVGYLYPMDGTILTIAGLFQSGQPVNLVPDARIFGTQDLNGDGLSFGENFVGNSDRYPGAKRNSARLPWSAGVDVSLRYAVPSFGGRFELSADVFNVLNANNKSGFANAATASNQIQFGGGAAFTQRNAGPPRQFQFGAAYKF